MNSETGLLNMYHISDDTINLSHIYFFCSFVKVTFSFFFLFVVCGCQIMDHYFFPIDGFARRKNILD